MQAMMLEAGYSPSSARQQSEILATIKDELKVIVLSLLELREQAIERMRKTGSYIGYKVALEGLDKLTKNIQLLSGHATERPQVVIDEATKAAIDRMINGAH